MSFGGYNPVLTRQAKRKLAKELIKSKQRKQKKQGLMRKAYENIFTALGIGKLSKKVWVKSNTRFGIFSPCKKVNMGRTVDNYRKGKRWSQTLRKRINQHLFTANA